MLVKTFHDNATATFTHVVVDESTNKCAVIDSVLDYDHFSGSVKTDSADAVIAYIKEHDLTNEWILESHIHADHITASSYLKTHIGGQTAMGKGIKEVLAIWVPMFSNQEDTSITGEQFDQLLDEGDTITIGNITLTTWLTPGHTPACASYYCAENQAIFVGDTMFAPHLGTARCDFPGGSAADLFKTVQRFYTLPDETQVYLCHDYPDDGEAAISVVSIADEKAHNIQIKPDTVFAEYVKKREARDATLAVPKLLFPSIQTNMRLGDFGVKSENGFQYIKIPVNAL
jgi:glyoxylase-like metal-dependent hydrolase (beta-lactamase superfamily II)